MKMYEAIEKTQQEYFEFCLSLLQKLPFEEVEKNGWVEKAYSIRDQLRKAIIDHRYDSTRVEIVKSTENEIEKLRTALYEKEHK
jgi:hypothetical protein